MEFIPRLPEMPEDRLRELYLKEPLDWESELVPVRLLVELPFWLLMPEAELNVSFQETSLKARVIHDYVAIHKGPVFLDSRFNLCDIVRESALSNPEQCFENYECPVLRHMKTVVEFSSVILIDAFNALAAEAPKPGTPEIEEAAFNYIRRLQHGNRYFYSFAFAHLPLVNKIIESYRVISKDPFAFEVSEWDTPNWWAEVQGEWVRCNLMHYWDADKYPHFPTDKGVHQIEMASTSEVQDGLKRQPVAGRHTLLDAWSFFYRGRFPEAIRSAVTAIEIAIESEIRQLLSDKLGSKDEVEQRLAQSRKSFPERLAMFEQLSGRRIPGPCLDLVPYINGTRLKQEVAWVREVRHRVVHEGERVDIFVRPLTLRAIETMTWLFDWIKKETFTQKHHQNYAYYCSVRSQPIFDFRHTERGIEVVRPPLADQNEEQQPLPLDYHLRSRQFVDSIESRADLELFIAMSLEAMQISKVDSPAGDFDRFRITKDGRTSSVMGVEINGLLTVEKFNELAVHSFAFARENGPRSGSVIVIHHQRDMPIGMREIEGAVTTELNELAIKCGITLITAVDLCFLVCGSGSFGWNPSQITDLLFLPGRQGAIPPCYRRVGSTARFFPQPSVVSIDLAANEAISVGDKIGIRLRHQYHEETVVEMEVNRTKVTQATGPVRVGIKTTITKKSFCVDLPVYRRIDAVTGTPEASGAYKIVNCQEDWPTRSRQYGVLADETEANHPK